MPYYWFTEEQWEAFQDRRRGRPKISKRKFRFNNHCFLCATELKKVKERSCKSKVVHKVDHPSMKKKVSQRAKARNDDWGKAILKRLELVDDLVVAKAQYHDACMKKLNEPPPEGKDKRIKAAMKPIYAYIEENCDTYRFPLNELMDKIEGDYRPSVKIVRKRLLKHFDDDGITIDDTDKKAPVVCLEKDTLSDSDESDDE